MKISSLFTLSVLALAMLAIGCKNAETVDTTPLPQPTGPKNEAPQTVGGQVVLPQNVAMEGGLRDDVEK